MCRGEGERRATSPVARAGHAGVQHDRRLDRGRENDMAMAEKDRKAVRNLVLLCAAALVIADPKEAAKAAAKVAAGGLVVAGVTILGIRWVQG
jgi:hypothetical protein